MTAHQATNLMKTSNIILVNNTNSDISAFDKIFINAIKTNSPLPDEIADLFDLKIIDAEDGVRGILNFA